MKLSLLVQRWQTCICPLEGHKPACLARRSCAAELEAALAQQAQSECDDCGHAECTCGPPHYGEERAQAQPLTLLVQRWREKPEHDCVGNSCEQFCKGSRAGTLDAADDLEAALAQQEPPCNNPLRSEITCADLVRDNDNLRAALAERRNYWYERCIVAERQVDERESKAQQAQPE